MMNFISHTGTVHMQRLGGTGHIACRSVTRFGVECLTDRPVTCGNCLRVIARAEALAHSWRDAILAGAAEAEEHHAADVKAFESGAFGGRDRMPFYLGQVPRARTLELRRTQVSYWFNRGDVDAMNSAGWALRRFELEQQYREQLAAAAELEAYEQRDLAFAQD